MPFFIGIIKKMESDQLAKNFAAAQAQQNFHVGSLPTAKDIEFLNGTLREDPDFIKFTPSEKIRFTDAIYQLERKKPIVTPDGQNIAAKYRLLILKDVVKTVFFRKEPHLPSLKAIIVYPYTHLLSAQSDAVGLADSGQSEQKHFFSVRRVIQISNAIVDLMDGSAAKHAKRLCQSFQELQAKLQKQISNEELLKRYSAEWPSLKSGFIHMMKSVISGYPEIVDKISADLNTLESRLPDTFVEYLVEYERTNRMVIHLSWKTHEFALKFSNSMHILIHEIAHAIDFEDGDLDGIPTPCQEKSHDAKEWATKWQQQFDRALNGQMKFMRKYALTNSREFFAVSSEYFFLRPDLVLKRAPELFELLKSTYGFVPEAKLKSTSSRVVNFFRGLSEPSDDNAIIEKTPA